MVQKLEEPAAFRDEFCDCMAVSLVEDAGSGDIHTHRSGPVLRIAIGLDGCFRGWAPEAHIRNEPSRKLDRTGVYV